jgi:Flp pilus assembly protein TadD
VRGACALVLLLLGGTGAARAADPVAPRRACFAAEKEEAVEACGAALRSGLGPRAAAVVRQALVAALVGLSRLPEVVALARDAAAEAPADATAQLELGAALLHFADAADDALAPLQAAVQLRPGDPRAYGELGLALHRLGQHPEAVAAFGEAERLDPAYFEDRPAAAAIFEASKRGQAWP